MRPVKKIVEHMGFTLLVENPMLKQKHLAPNQMQEVIERYARDHNMTTEAAVKKARVPKWVVAGVGMGRAQAHQLQLTDYPKSKYRIVGVRLDTTPLEVVRERGGNEDSE